jgi:hypothetical protein
MSDPNWWNAAPGGLFGDDDLFDDDLPLDEDEDGFVDCPRCDGTGLTPEGWDCEYCEGDGEIEA